MQHTEKSLQRIIGHHHFIDDFIPLYDKNWSYNKITYKCFKKIKNKKYFHFKSSAGRIHRNHQ